MTLHDFLLFALPAVFLTGLSKGGFGGALGGIAVPLLALATSPKQAVAVMLPRAIYDRLATGDWLPELRAPRAIEWAGLAVPLAPILVIAACWWALERRQTPPGRIAAALWGLVLVSALGQAFALRHVAAERRQHAGMLARVRAAAGEEGVVLSDVADASRLLLPMARVLPALEGASGVAPEHFDGVVFPTSPEQGGRLHDSSFSAARGA